MKNHSRSNTKRGSLGYRTPSSFRFTAHQKARDQQVKNPKFKSDNKP